MKKVFVSGCFDMLHSGHVAFLEEAAGLGELHVGVGSDATIMQLKGRSPINCQEERLYMIKALRVVHNAFVCTGGGILDFAEDIEKLMPDILFVNADGANRDKERLCARLGIECIVGIRQPHEGLPARSTTSYRSDCKIPYRIDLAGGWLDQATFSKLSPGPVITISIEPTFDFLDRAGMATSTRNKAIELWSAQLPVSDAIKSARTLFCYENPPGKECISGSQDSLGIVLPGLNLLYYTGQFWPDKIESCTNDEVLNWLQRHIGLKFIKQRELDYDPYCNCCITGEYCSALADASWRCWDAILQMNFEKLVRAFTDSFNSQVRAMPEMITPEVKDAAASLPSNARGWKLAGAGGGGYLVALLEEPGMDFIPIQIRRVSQ